VVALALKQIIIPWHAMKRSNVTLIVFILLVGSRAEAQLPNTELLDWEGDLASKMIDGIDRFLLREIAESVTRRDRHWHREFSSAEKYQESVLPNRNRLRHILGLRDERLQPITMQLMASVAQSATVASTEHFDVLHVRWELFDDVHGEGLLLQPKLPAKASVVVIPDAEQTPASLVNANGYACQLAANGCRVVIPRLVSRQTSEQRAGLTNREYLYRSAFELGRHMIGYEIQKVLAAVDWFETTSDGAELSIGVIGWGEGGLLALYSAAVDPRIDVCGVGGYFGPRNGIWNEPIDRNVFGLLDQFGDAEVATLVAPRPLVIDTCDGPTSEVRTNRGAPYSLANAAAPAIADEIERAHSLVRPLGWRIATSRGDVPGSIGQTAVRDFADALRVELVIDSSSSNVDCPPFTDQQERRVQELDRFSQRLLEESPYVRQAFMSKLDVSSVEAHGKSVESYRSFFRDEVIGRFDRELLPANPRTRKVYDEPTWEGYEVVLDVLPDVFAQGILLLPNNIKANEQRPVVVCQHGLEGRPRDTIEGDQNAYHDFAKHLAERGFITFAPQNIYIFRDRFRTLQRKANPLGKTLFSVMVPQHQQITDWLATLPQVDAKRIGFYGLSYGGKSAMRIPPLVERYCLAICSADFNDWVWKNASTRSPYSYVWTGEYEIFEFDLGSTFNYSEMASLIAPKPFMVERGHFDGVAPDERVALEFAKVRHLYQAQLGIGDRCEIEFFVGPHTINGKGTFSFLHRHLNWPDARRD
jgi:dienelactone hydrolase